MNEKKEGKVLNFWFSQSIALLPIVLYVILSGFIMITFQYYSMKALTVAAVVSILIGFIFCKNKSKYWEVVVSGLAQNRNARLLFIFIVIGILSKLLVVGKIGAGFIWLSLQLNFIGGTFVVFCFFASALISMGAGAPIAALLAVVPIFYPAGVMMGANPALLVGAMLSGIFFGDALSPSSQVTHITTLTQHDFYTKEPARLIPTMKIRLPYVLGSGVVSIILFFLLGGYGGEIGDINILKTMADPKGLWMTIPIIILLVICFKTSNLFLGVTYAIICGILLGLLTGLFNMQDIIFIDAQVIHGILFDGILGITDILISTIFLYGLIAIAVKGGMIDKFCEWIISKKFSQSKIGAETVIAGGVGIANVLLAGCVLPSILMFGDIADQIGQKANIDPNRRSVLLTAMATNITAIIPINSAFVMGAITIISELKQKNPDLPIITPWQIFISTYYCIFLTLLCLCLVVFGIGRKKVNK
ncbi:hypothetical protein [Enterococcus sp. DIV1420a]|uniref:hypothetical protein n=1 Tax=Enterococcus sp. DIV1420a TaxID=2774672 RepID=UPI003F2392A5